MSGYPNPLYKVYIDDDGEVHLVAPDSKNTWDGKAFFLGYTHISIRDADGYEIGLPSHEERLKNRRQR